MFYFFMWRIMQLCVKNSINGWVVQQTLSDIELQCVTVGEGGTRVHGLHLVIPSFTGV